MRQAKLTTGFDANGEVLLIEVFPNKQNGCLIYFSKLNQGKKKTPNTIFNYYTFEYLNIENIIESSLKLSQSHGHKIHKSSLYKDLNNERYFLFIIVAGDGNKEITSLMKEFAVLRSKEKLFYFFIDEYYKLIIKDNALETIQNNFM